jgi:hypothetical protein
VNGARIWPLLAIAGGLATLVIFVGFNFLPAVTAAYAPGTLGEAESTFQRAASMADLFAVFDNPPSAARLAAQDAVNKLDLYGFVPAYTLFLVAAAAMLAGGARQPLAWLAIAPALVGAGADAVETLAQLRVLADWEHAAAQLPIAPWHWAKYMALAGNGVGVAAIALLGARKRYLLGVLAMAPLPCVLAVWSGLIADARVFSVAFALYWVVLLAHAFMGAKR